MSETFTNIIQLGATIESIQKVVGNPFVRQLERSVARLRTDWSCWFRWKWHHLSERRKSYRDRRIWTSESPGACVRLKRLPASNFKPPQPCMHVVAPLLRLEFESLTSQGRPLTLQGESYAMLARCIRLQVWRRPVPFSAACSAHTRRREFRTL